MPPLWVDVCGVDELLLGRGSCALVGNEQVALFRVDPLDGSDDDLYALSNYDPFSKAHVLSRGIVGTRGDRLKVASPVYKQSFDLKTGECLDDPDVTVRAYEVRTVGHRVQVALP